MKDIEIGIVVLNYKSYRDTIKCVSTYLSQKNINLHIVIVDNASNDNSFSILCGFFENEERVTVLESKTNGGYASGNNVGIHYLNDVIKCKWVIVSNNDIIINDDFLVNKWLVKHKQKNDVIMSAPLMRHCGSPSKYAAWRIPSIYNTLKSSLRIFEYLFGDTKIYNLDFNQKEHFVDCLPGSLFMIKMSDFVRLELFDEGTFLYMEEVILAYKIKSIGGVNCLFSDLQYDHEISKCISSNVSNHMMRRYLVESQIYFHVKYQCCNQCFIYLILLLNKIRYVESFFVDKLKAL